MGSDWCVVIARIVPIYTFTVTLYIPSESHSSDRGPYVRAALRLWGNGQGSAQEGVDSARVWGLGVPDERYLFMLWAVS